MPSYLMWVLWRRLPLDLSGASGPHQFPKGIGVKDFNAYILVRLLDEPLNVLVLSFLYFDVLLQSDDLSLQPLLLRLVALAQHIKPLVTQASAGVVLVNLDKEPFQFGDALLVPAELLADDLQFLRALQLHLLFHHGSEVVLMPEDIPHHHLHMLQDQLL